MFTCILSKNIFPVSGVGWQGFHSCGTPGKSGIQIHLGWGHPCTKKIKNKKNEITKFYKSQR